MNYCKKSIIPSRRLRFEMQRDTMTCGLAALSMVCGWWGVRYGVERLERLCPPTREGVSMLGLQKTASMLGLDAKGVRMMPEALAGTEGPVILHWDQNHFVVLYGVERGGERYRIADPAKGCMKMGRRELLEHWTADPTGRTPGVALLATPGEEFGQKVAPDPGRRPSLRFLGRYLRDYRRYYVHILAGMALGCVLQLILPFLTQAIVDRGIRHSDMGFIWMVLLGELMIVAGSTATDFVRRWMVLHISLRINVTMVSDFFVKLLSLPMGYFDTRLTGDLIQRVADHGRVREFMTGQVLGILFSGVTLVVLGVVLAVYDLTVFGVFATATAAYAVWLGVFLRRRRVIDYKMFALQGVNNSRTYELITSMQEIKLQDCERRRRRDWEETQTELFGVQAELLRLQQVRDAGAVLITEVKNIFITVLAAGAVIEGQITLGAMLAIQFIVGQLNSPVEQMMQFVYALQDVMLSLERINEIHGKDPEDTPRDATPAPGCGGLELRGVRFRYDPFSPGDVIDGIDLDIAPGTTVAVVGESGSGKTTLVKLLLGYYPCRSGSVRVGGRDLTEMNMRQWRRRCGAVMQDGVIFSESIARNIAVADGEMDMERVREAARMAALDGFVESLPLGYDTRVGRDGVGLSQGQRQRILIARMVYRNPDYIFLDEATNSLDAANERAIVENLAGFYRGRTVVVVAHRLSTVRDADCIVVMDKGRIAEQGTHAELVERRGHYYTLVHNQLELAQ